MSHLKAFWDYLLSRPSLLFIIGFAFIGTGLEIMFDTDGVAYLATGIGFAITGFVQAISIHG